MKLVKKWTLFLFALLLSCSLLIPNTTVHASESDEDYYYTNIDITAVINDKREYEITEVLDVYFNTSKHGIIRTIPLSSDVEGYTINNINVTGAPFSVTDNYSSVAVKIGSADYTVTGAQRYVVTYTLSHYRDYDNTADYIYLNLLGSEFDTYVMHFQAKVILKDGLTINSQTINSGYRSNRGNELDIQCSVKKNEYTYTYTQDYAINPYNAITVQMVLDEGAFKNAPVYVHTYTAQNKHVTVDVQNDKSYHFTIQETYTNNTNESIYVYDDLAFSDEYDIYTLSDLNYRKGGENAYYSKDNNYLCFTLAPNETREIEYTYTLTSKTVYISSFMSWDLWNGNRDAEVVDFAFDITYPNDDFTYKISAGRDNDESVITKTDDGAHITIQNTKTLYTGEGISFSVEYGSNMFHRSTPFYYWIATVLSGLLGAIYLIYRTCVIHSEKPVETVEFYPPDGLNSIEAGYLIDNSVDNKDITSMIFYWASKGYLTIEKISKKTYEFCKLRNPDPTTPAYELKLFTRFFNYGDGGVVTTTDLEENFYVAAQKARKDVTNLYDKSNRRIYDEGGAKYRALATLLAYLPITLAWTLIGYQYFGSWGSAAMFGGFFGLSFSFIVIPLNIIFNPKRKPSVFTIIFTSIFMISYLLCAIPIIIGLGFTADKGISTLVIVSNISSLLIILCSLGVNTYTPYGLDLIGRLLGFKTFIKTAEKDRLEALLEEDPNYFYEILPYAQVLHVSKIWEKKFENILIAPPDWYRSNEPFLYHSFMHDMNDLHNHSHYDDPPYSSDSGGSGGGYSGGGGSFSGGASSGGGSGGGGSSSW